MTNYYQPLVVSIDVDDSFKTSDEKVPSPVLKSTLSIRSGIRDGYRLGAEKLQHVNY